MRKGEINTTMALPYPKWVFTGKFNRHLLVAILLFIYTVIQSYAITRLTINYDEESFLMYGITLLKGQANKDIRKYESKLPITAINALPRAIEQISNPALKKDNPEEDVIAGRFLSLLVSLVLGILIYYWSSQWYGFAAGLSSLVFYLLCPNFLAHAIFLSSDIYACLFIALTTYFFSRFSTKGKTQDFIVFSFCFGMGLISKFSLLHMVPILGIIVAIKYYTFRGKARLFTKRHIALLLTFIFTNWLIISASHLFYDMFFPLNQYTYRSFAFGQLTEMLGRLAGYIHIPLPSSYFRSMDIVMFFDNLGGGLTGSINGKPYILGQYNTHGFWYYYLVSFLFKVPIPLIIILTAGLILYGKEFKFVHFFQREVFLAVPVFYYLVYMSCFYSTQIGIRHILIIFPFLFVFAGYLFHWIYGSAFRWIIPVMMVWELISVGSYFPHFLPYTNEFILQKKNAYKKIGDTNLCYSEGRQYLNEYLATNKNAVYSPKGRVSGIVVIEVNDFLGIQENSIDGKYDWLHGQEPVGHIHSQYLIFDVPGK
jgi:hypothetical protein